MNANEHILIELLCVIIADLRRRSFDESGEQMNETVQWIKTLKGLLIEMRGEK